MSQTQLPTQFAWSPACSLADDSKVLPFKLCRWPHLPFGEQLGWEVYSEFGSVHTPRIQSLHPPFVHPKHYHFPWVVLYALTLHILRIVVGEVLNINHLIIACTRHPQ
jgi:hypothetical protein